MFQNLGLHVIDFPTGRFGFVGSVPASLGNLVPATTNDIMGGRSFQVDGKPMAVKFPSFETRDAAVAFAASKGFTVR